MGGGLFVSIPRHTDPKQCRAELLRCSISRASRPFFRGGTSRAGPRGHTDPLTPSGNVRLFCLGRPTKSLPPTEGLLRFFRGSGGIGSPAVAGCPMSPMPRDPRGGHPWAGGSLSASRHTDPKPCRAKLLRCSISRASCPFFEEARRVLLGLFFSRRHFACFSAFFSFEYALHVNEACRLPASRLHLFATRAHSSHGSG